MLNTTVSHYRIVEHLGGGGMGVVYKAEDTKLGRTVALKFLPPEWSRDPDARERFLREARAASALEDSRICTIHDIDETDDGRLFIAMAFYEGETLKKRLERGRLPIGEAVDIAIHVAEGLERAHSAEILHRDIKPANLMLTGHDEVVIVDFGLAIETHAFALRVLSELDPTDERRHGMVQWLLLNKKLNHWKSTRATAEVIFSLVHYLEQENGLGVREDATVIVGPRITEMIFEPDEYTGARNRVVVPGPEVDPKTMSTIVVEKEAKGFAFASATWHFSTEKLPEEARGDLFAVTRQYFRRLNDGNRWVLRPLADGEELAPGDQVEVHLSIRAKHAAEYVHLRDPRGAGFEPETLHSQYKWDLGIGWYEEVRDSGTNFFFEWLPAGEYTFKYRLRANMAGAFKVGPATLQSMYAPEFTAYSAGHQLEVVGE